MQKSELIRKMLPGLLPLFVFIIADEIWGTKIGLLVAVGFGIIEFAYTYFKEKRFDKFIIIDTLLLIVLGLVSYLLENDIFFKLKPALIEIILCAILGYSGFSNKNILLMMSRRYMKDIEINEQQQKQMVRSIRIMFYLFSAHTLLVIYSAYYMSKEAWAFISGGLFYILFGVYFVLEIANNKIRLRKMKNEEWLPLVDEQGTVKGKAPRSECHKGKGMLHPVVHIHIINMNGEIFLQKRPLHKETQPGKWDTAVGGHISFGETLEVGLKREAEEEIGIRDFTPVFMKKYVWESDVESELVYMFYARYDKPLNINKEELEDGKFWSMKDIDENVGKQIFTPNFVNEIPVLKKIVAQLSFL